ncbi:MAG: ADP-ribosylglycohydrolase family protein [Bacilli bacterium]|nr:ADP-ribosylglycohydrolase family protein [Bacilli bacterium]
MSNYKTMIPLHSYKGTIGAAIGDVYGSYYEFQHGPKTPKHEIRIHESSCFTDDTVLTAAVADYLKRKTSGENVSPTKVVQAWARKYADAGYGGYFRYHWLYNDDPKPYNSFGNGSAMRVSSVAYYAHDLKEVEQLATEVTAITHNHPEGIKGAVVTATAIFMAFNGASREEIGNYASKHYDLNLDYEDMMKELGHGEEICQVTVPQALWCFLHSDSFEDCLRLCLHLRFDADTLAAIACPIAEAFYKEIPEELIFETKARLPQDILAALESVPKGN